MKTLKLGTQTGSLINHLQSRAASQMPDPEKGATELHWTDRSAYFVNSVSKDGKTCEIERAKAIRIDGLGMSDSQDYKYERDPKAIKYTLKFRYGAWWKDLGDNPYRRYQKISIRFGSMDEYFDYSF